MTTDDATTCYLTIDKKGECRIHAQKIDFIFNQRGLTIDGTQHDVFIDPDNDLISSDARFREVSIIKDIETREGTTYIKHQKARVLVDDGDEIEEIPISGGVVDIDVGNTTTGEPGTNASVEKRLEDGKVILDFTIPKGSQGENGAPAGFGTPSAVANTLSAGALATANVVASGPDTEKVFSFTFGIPKGDKGDKGDPGEGSGLTEDFYFIGDVKYESHTLYKRVDRFDHTTGKVGKGKCTVITVAEAI